MPSRPPTTVPCHMRGPRVVLVGQRNGQRHIRWAAAILVTLHLALILVAVQIAMFGIVSYWLTDSFWWWNHSPFFVGFLAIFPVWLASIVVGSGVIRALHGPVDELTPLP
jgi:hypothetical protein